MITGESDRRFLRIEKAGSDGSLVFLLAPDNESTDLQGQDSSAGELSVVESDGSYFVCEGVAKDRLLEIPVLFDEDIIDCALSGDGTVVASAYHDGRIVLWRLDVINQRLEELGLQW